MIMRKILAIGTLAAAMTGNLFAANSGEIEDFFYNRGYKSGYTTGYEKGYAKAMEDAKRILSRYKDRIQAIEVGKYLIEENKITAPEVWQVKDNSGNIRVVVRGCKIENELSIEDIFQRFGKLPEGNEEDFAKVVKSNISTPPVKGDAINSVYLADRDSGVNAMPDRSDRESRKSYLFVPKTYNNKRVLDKANVVYMEKNNGYEVLFFSRAEKQSFCKNFPSLCK